MEMGAFCVAYLQEASSDPDSDSDQMEGSNSSSKNVNPGSDYSGWSHHKNGFCCHMQA